MSKVRPFIIICNFTNSVPTLVRSSFKVLTKSCKVLSNVRSLYYILLTTARVVCPLPPALCALCPVPCALCSVLCALWSHPRPAFAAGSVMPSCLVELLMSQAFFSPTTLLFWEALVGIGRPHGGYQRGGASSPGGPTAQGTASSASIREGRLESQLSYNHEALPLESLEVAQAYVGGTYRMLVKRCVRPRGREVRRIVHRPAPTDLPPLYHRRNELHSQKHKQTLQRSAAFAR